MAGLHHMVVGVDGSEGSRRALEWASAQADGGQLTVVHGFSAGLELLAAAVQINLDPVRTEYEKLLDTTWSEPARTSSTEVATVFVDDNPAAALVSIALRESADAIVIGHQGNSRWSRHHVGDIAGRLLHRCDLPLILTSDSTEPRPMAGSIVVGLSRPADDKNPELCWTLQVAEQHDLQVHLVSLVEPLAYLNASYSFDMARIHTEIRQQMDELVAQIRPRHRSIGISSEVRDGGAASELASVAAERDACMVVVGAHHPGPMAGFFAGSVARLLPPLLSCAMTAVPVA